MVILQTHAKKRGSDDWGQGHFGASRGGRLHNGQDYLADVGNAVVSPFYATVSKIGFPYSQAGPSGHYTPEQKSRFLAKRGMRYVELDIGQQTKVRYFYVSPHPNATVGSHVNMGDVIGMVQDLDAVYDGMPLHVHAEVWLEGKRINPDEWWLNRINA